MGFYDVANRDKVSNHEEKLGASATLDTVRSSEIQWDTSAWSS